MDDAVGHDTALAAPAYAYVDFGVAHGLSRDKLMAASQLPEAGRHDPDARCGHFAFIALWRELLTGLPDICVPVALANWLDPAALGVIAQIVPRADDVRHAHALVARFMALSDTALGYRELSRDDRIGIEIVHRPEVHAMRFPIELMTALGHRLLVMGAGKSLAREITFAHPAGYPIAEYERLFGVPVTFEQPQSATWFDRAALETPFPHRDPIARRYFEAYADRQLEAIPKVDPIREAVLVELATSGAELARVAKRLALSTRTLQRRLEEQGTSYQDVVDDVRASLAKTLLRDAKRSILDVAFELGYSDLKSFYRAFRRWTETTPAEWRASNLTCL